MLKKRNLIKYLPNMLSISRIGLSIFMVFLKFLSPLFWIVYIIAGLTDLLDGHIARKLKTESNLGAILDSIGDFVFFVVLGVIFATHLTIPLWALLWVVGVFCIRASSLVVGWLKYRSLSFLHTYLNKFTGLVIFCFPLMYVVGGTTFMLALICVTATFSSVEELAINIKSHKLDRDIKSILN